MRTIRASHKLFGGRTVLRATALDQFAGQWRPDIQFAVRVNTEHELTSLANIVAAGVGNASVLTADAAIFGNSTLPGILDLEGATEEGDVLGLTPGLDYVRVLFRESDLHHTVFLTNRCNSNCLMCSQPPTRHDDSWLVDEAVSVANHMRLSPDVVGFTGGEPLLLGGQLRLVLDSYRRQHPKTQLEILTNGRLFSDAGLANQVLSGLREGVMWMVPLYGHTDFLHDYVVQARGAFDQTIDGLLTLRACRQPIQLRTVLIEPVLRILPEFCEFIGRNLPFVREVALMGCEPIGFALANREQCQVDLAEWEEQIFEAVSCLRSAGLSVMLMNAPLCALPMTLWRYAHQSISDWKKVYADECEECTVRVRCCGLFASYKKGWRPTAISPLFEGIAHEAL